LTLFPDLKQSDYLPKNPHFMPTGAEQRELVARHTKNAKPLLCVGWA